MLFAKKEYHNMDAIRTTSKDALKRSLMHGMQEVTSSNLVFSTIKNQGVAIVCNS